MTDLLGEQGGGGSHVTSPSIYLPRTRPSTVQLSDFTELRASTAQQCASYFDTAVSSRTASLATDDDDAADSDDDNSGNNRRHRGGSTMIFSLHVYQYMVDKVGTGEIHGGRSRLHLIDLSGCSRHKRSRDSNPGSRLPTSALGNVIVSLANGTRHIPHRDSKLTSLLREVMGSLSVRVNIIASVATDAERCFETLATLQVTSRIHRSRRKKSRISSASSSGGDSSCDDRRKLRRRHKPVTPLFRTDTCQSDNIGEMDMTSTSATESCDTVIYRGPGSGGSPSDRELTDYEHPPNSVTSPLHINVDDVNMTPTKKNKFISTKNENKMAARDEEIVGEEAPIIVNISPCSFLNPSLERKPKDKNKTNSSDHKYSASSGKYSVLSGKCPDTMPQLPPTSEIRPAKSILKQTVPINEKSPTKRAPKTSSHADDAIHATKTCSEKHRRVFSDINKTNSLDRCRGNTKDKCNEKAISEKCEGKLKDKTLEQTGETCRNAAKKSTQKCKHKTSGDKDRDKENLQQQRHTTEQKEETIENNERLNRDGTIPPDTRARLENPSRKCASTNTSPAHVLACNETSCTSACSRLVRTCSLDSVNRTKGCCCNSGNPCVNGNLRTTGGTTGESTDTIASMNAVVNFERDLVAKIADRFALEDELTNLQKEGEAIFQGGGDDKGGTAAVCGVPKVIPFANEDYFIDDDFDTVCAGLENEDDLEYFTPEPLSPTHLEQSEARDNQIIPCNVCLGTCTCGNARGKTNGDVRHSYDSEDDTDEKTNNDLNERFDGKRSSFGSCDSHLDVSPRNFHKHPPSEGLSSGYESMRCESSGTIHLSTDTANDKGREVLESKKDPFDEVLEEVDVEGGDQNEENLSRSTRGEKYRNHIKKLIEERQDLKTQLHQTLKKLVLNRVPLPRIDDHLRQISLNCSNRDTTKMLSRENRIMERKVKVCKSHLQLVACFDNMPTAPTTTTTTHPSPLPSPRKRHQQHQPQPQCAPQPHPPSSLQPHQSPLHRPTDNKLSSPSLGRVIGKVTSV